MVKLRKRILSFLLIFLLIPGLSQVAYAADSAGPELNPVSSEISESELSLIVDPASGEKTDESSDLQSEESAVLLPEQGSAEEQVVDTVSESESSASDEVLPEEPAPVEDVTVIDSDAVNSGEPFAEPTNPLLSELEVALDGWQLEAEGWRYYLTNRPLTGGWFWLAGSDGSSSWEYFDDRGFATDQIYEENGNRWYSQAGPDLAYARGWMDFEGNRYFFRTSSGTQVKGWQYIDGYWRYFREDGSLVRSEWVWLPIDDEGTYNWKFFNFEGKSIDQYYREGGNIWYSHAGPSSDYAKGWKDMNGFRYYFRPGTGTRVSGWQYIEGSWRYFRDTGTMVQSAWLWAPVDGGRVYNWKFFNFEGRNIDQYYKSGGYTWYSQAGPNTEYARGWKYLHDAYYYFRSGSGTRVSGLQKIDGDYYYFNETNDNPYLITSQRMTINGQTYYFNEDGVGTYQPGEWNYLNRLLYRRGVLYVYDRYGDLLKSREVGSDHVLISLNHQYMWIFNDGEVVFSTPVITGKPSTPTVIGNFYIYSKETDRELVGPTWQSWVDYWVPFYGGYGIHDASWQDYYSFYLDSDTYLYSGSHGCVNVRPDVMWRVYQSVYVGMPVTVVPQ